MLFTTAGKSMETSLPTVMAAMTFFTASFFLIRSSEASSSLSSWISPALLSCGWCKEEEEG